MGLRKEYVEFLLNVTNVQSGYKILELGNQLVREPSDFAGCATGKEFFGKMGMYHISMDLNGKNGAIECDFNKKVKGWDSEFDIVFNSGFTICVERWKTAYKNAYNMCKMGGVVVHVLPVEGSKWTCNHYVNIDFFKSHCNSYGFEIIDYVERDGVNGGLAYCAMKKVGFPGSE